MMIKQVAHICIGSTDLEKTADFYCNVLGMERGFDFLKNDALYGFYVKAGKDTYIEVFSQDEVKSERPLLQHLCFEVEDLEAVVKEIEAKGVAVTPIKQGGDQSWQAWITDPSGVRIELMQYTPESSQFTGNPCIVTW